MMDLRNAGSILSEHRQHDRNGLSCGLSGEPGGERHAGFALMENEHRPCALTNDEVTLPMAALGSAVDGLGPFVDGDAILDGILRRSRPAWPAAFVTTREITPQLLGPLGCPIDEGNSRPADDVRFLPSASRKFAPGSTPPRGGRQRRFVGRDLVRSALHAACAIDRLRRREAASSVHSAAYCGRESWSRLSEQFFRFDKWSLCRG